TIGHSDLLNGTISGGIVAGMGTVPAESGGQSIELIQLNINHYQGDSGGPVFDNQGRLLGLMSAKRLTKDRACFAVPANKIHFVYNQLDKP
ncbi:MAG: serine protease, partial [Candidatus Omnitrophica bacterium]|nr:serine protease [Candidatus Omnitrophota bacterium]